MIKKLQALKAKKGFTLVELIVVIAIIGVLAAILVPTMMGYVTSSQITSLNSTAASIKNNIDTFLTNADTAGYGMYKGASNKMELTITISGGTWTVSTSATGNATKSTANMSWGSGGSGAAASTKVGVTKAESLLAIELADLFPTVQTGKVWALCEGGKCVAVCYSEDSAVSDHPKSSDFSAEKFSWNTNTAGITSSGASVGTAPALPLG